MRNCKECGAPVEEGMNVCPYCGATLKTTAREEEITSAFTEEDNGNNTYNYDDSYQTKKKQPSIHGSAIGFILGFFLGIIGLILGIVLGDEKCKKATIIGFVISIVAYFVVSVISMVAFGSYANEQMNSATSVWINNFSF